MDLLLFIGGLGLGIALPGVVALLAGRCDPAPSPYRPVTRVIRCMHGHDPVPTSAGPFCVRCRAELD